ncbi:GAF domain-containing sensor histidine kinase [Candidatus Daviesbacteria bacterium]|nr:GAF domain-containing sensor histidine kinase [Candidatus Daviesbacteria bacterium]
MDDILKKIHKSALKFLIPLTPEQTYKLIVEEALKLTKADFGSIFLGQDGELKRVYTTYPFLSQVALRPKGFTYKAFKKKQALIVDVKYQPNVNPKIKELGVKSDLLVPLSYRNISVGVLSLLSKKSDYFSSDHLAASRLFADVASLAIRESQFYETRAYLGNILEKIHKSALKFLIPLTPEQTYKLIVEEAMKLVGADIGHILLEQQGELKRIYSSNPALYSIKTRKRGFMHSVFSGRRPLILSDRDIVPIHPSITNLGVRTSLGIPLSYRHESIGVLGLMSFKPNFFTKKEVTILQLFAPLASLAIRKTQLYNETKRAVEARDLFISMAAHELRTPVTTISGYSQLLHSKFAASDAPESKWVADLSWEALRLTYLINELLEVNRIRSGQLQYIWKECSLKEIVRRALSDFHFTHPEHQVIVQDSLDSQGDLIVGDFNKLLQAMINLLDNSAKFSSADTKIDVTLKAQKSYLILQIKDQGRGIKKKDLPEVFEKFYQGSGHSEEGMGLGLFLVKNIIKQHHGAIEIKSKENKGTSVTVRLPRIKSG